MCGWCQKNFLLSNVLLLSKKICLYWWLCKKYFLFRECVVDVNFCFFECVVFLKQIFKVWLVSKHFCFECVVGVKHFYFIFECVVAVNKIIIFSNVGLMSNNYFQMRGWCQNIFIFECVVGVQKKYFRMCGWCKNIFIFECVVGVKTFLFSNVWLVSKIFLFSNVWLLSKHFYFRMCG